jgi:signal-transduction protein with cAMP-binding, CBS, and nucleotidyltransferase domain
MTLWKFQEGRGILPTRIQHFNHNQGETLTFSLTVTDDVGQPLPVLAFRMDVKKTLSDENPIYSFNSDGVSVVVDPDLSGSGVPEEDNLIDAVIVDNVVTVTLGPDFTFIPAVINGGKFLYDAYIELASGRHQVLKGQYTVNAAVTRWET